MPARSEPIPGSVIAMAVISSPEAMPGSHRCCCSSVARSQEVRQADVVVQAQPEPRAGRPGAHDLLVQHCVEPEVGHPAATELLRDRHAEKAGRAGGGEQLPRHDAIGLPGRQLRHDLLGQESADALAEGLMLGLEQPTAHVTMSLLW